MPCLILGRHILAKIFAVGVSEYKEVAKRLGENSVLLKDEVVLLKNELNGILRIKSAYLRWLKGHPNMLDETL